MGKSLSHPFEWYISVNQPSLSLPWTKMLWLVESKEELFSKSITFAIKSSKHQFLSPCASLESARRSRRSRGCWGWRARSTSPPVSMIIQPAGKRNFKKLWRVKSWNCLWPVKTLCHRCLGIGNPSKRFHLILIDTKNNSEFLSLRNNISSSCVYCKLTRQVPRITCSKWVGESDLLEDHHFSVAREDISWHQPLKEGSILC